MSNSNTKKQTTRGLMFGCSNGFGMKMSFTCFLTRSWSGKLNKPKERMLVMVSGTVALSKIGFISLGG